jgi:hypothetical protein
MTTIFMPIPAAYVVSKDRPMAVIDTRLKIDVQRFAEEEKALLSGKSLKVCAQAP